MSAGDDLGTLTLTRFNGTAVYRLASAEVRVYRFRDVTELEFAVRAAEGAVQAPADPDFDTTVAPHAHVTVLLDQVDPAALAGRRFTVPGGYGTPDFHRVSNFYLHEHEPLSNNVVEVLGGDPTGYRVRWTAATADPDVYDGSAPDARVVVEGTFRLGPVRDVPYTRARADADPRFGWHAVGLFGGSAAGLAVAWVTEWGWLCAGAAVGGLVGFWVGDQIGNRIFKRRMVARYEAPVPGSGGGQ